MAVERLASICVFVAVASAVAAGQERSNTTNQEATTTVIERNSAAGSASPWRRVETRTESATREVVKETFELPDIDGRVAPFRETVVETVRTSPVTTQATRDVFMVDTNRRRQLVETTDSQLETAPNGDTAAVHDIRIPDLNGRLNVATRQVERTRSVSPTVRETETSVLVPLIDGPLGEIDRHQSTERQVSPGVVRHDSTYQSRDINGRWQAIETRGGDTREISQSERVEDETVQQLDMNGMLADAERSVTRRVRTAGQDQEVTETYVPYASVWPSADRGLILRDRIQRTTTATADGSLTIEETQSVNPQSVSDPMRVVRRIVTTTRRIDANRSATDRQVFERDVNGRMVLVADSSEDRAGR